MRTSGRIVSRRTVWLSGIATGAALLGKPASGLHEPGHLLQIVVSFAPGGQTDAVARILAKGIDVATGHPVVVENKPGGGGRVGAAFVQDQRPDGSVVLLSPSALLAISPLLNPDFARNLADNFRPVAGVAEFDYAIAVAMDSPMKSLPELVKRAREVGKDLMWGVVGGGALAQLVAGLLGMAIDVKLSLVPYSNSNDVVIALLGGQVPVVIVETATIAKQHAEGRVRVLATTGKARSPLLPEVKTVEEQGIRLEAVNHLGVFAPAGTPNDIVKTISDAIVEAVSNPEVRNGLERLGAQASGQATSQFAETYARDQRLWTEAIVQLGLKP